jgi:hypothetical protein
MEMIKDWLVVDLKNLVDTSNYVEAPPINFEKEDSNIIHGKSFSRYGEPKFKNIHYEVKNKLEIIMAEKLYPTYYFDRFYFPHTKMTKHVDREACEISVSLNISQNLPNPWALWFDMGNEVLDCYTKPGDGVLYRGMEVPHWRDRMEGNKNSYCHQIFLHYVRADGHFLEYAFDKGTKLDTYTHKVPRPK